MAVSKILVFTSIAVVFMLQSACITTRQSLEAKREKQEVAEGIQTLQRGKADLEAQLEESFDEMKALKGRIEVLEKEKADAQVALEEERTQKEDERKKKEEQFTLLMDSVSQLQEKYDLLVKDYEAFKKAQRKKPAQKKKPAKKLGNYQKAELDFSKGRWREAALSYEEYRKLNPKGKRYQRATFRMGVSFKNLKMKDEAKIFFEELVNTYKTGKYANLAREELKQLK